MTETELAALVRLCRSALESRLEGSDIRLAGIDEADLEALIAAVLRTALEKGLGQPC